MATWVHDSGAAVACLSWQVAGHAAVALPAAEAQAPAGTGVHNQDELAQEGLQEPQLGPHMLQAVLYTDDGRHGVQPADGRLCSHYTAQEGAVVLKVECRHNIGYS